MIECNKFEQQTLISAIPHTQEFQDFSTLMPQGIGPIGIYHSHPFSSGIFHSHTDDKTLLSLSNQFSNCISLVTNGKEINYYQMNEKDQIYQIKPQFIIPESLKFILISLKLDLEINIDSNLLIDKNNNLDLKIKIKILNKLKENLENVWDSLDFSFQNKKISIQNSIENYLVDKLLGDSIQIKFPQDHSTLRIIISNNTETDFNSRYNVKLKLIVKTPVYVANNKKILSEIKQSIKTELLSNIILQKIYYSIFSDDKSSLLLPNDYYVSFFGFFIRFLYFNNPEMNERMLSSKNYELIVKLISLFKNLSNMEIDKIMKDYIEKFLIDIENFSVKFKWQKKYKKEILSIKKEYNL